MVYRCGTWDRNPMVAISPLLLDIPGPPFYDLYMSRMGLDPAYARIANHALDMIGDEFANSRLAEELRKPSQRTPRTARLASEGAPGSYVAKGTRSRLRGGGEARGAVDAG